MSTDLTLRSTNSLYERIGYMARDLEIANDRIAELEILLSEARKSLECANRIMTRSELEEYDDGP